jgi:hypothetical protein
MIFDTWVDDHYNLTDYLTETDLRSAWQAGAESERELIMVQLNALDVDSYASARELFETIQVRLLASAEFTGL